MLMMLVVVGGLFLAGITNGFCIDIVLISVFRATFSDDSFADNSGAPESDLTQQGRSRLNSTGGLGIQDYMDEDPCPLPRIRSHTNDR